MIPCMIRLIRQLFGPKMEVVVNNDEQQIGTEDCGLFAIANCICLANRKSPSAKYDQSQMRLHLVNCIEKMNFTEFPYEHA